MNWLNARRKEWMLGMLIAALAVVLWVNLTGEEDAYAPGAAGPGDVAGHPDIAGIKVFPVEWAALAAAPPSYDPAGRNIFQFGVIPPPPPPKLTDAELAAIAEAQRRAAEERERQAELLRQQQLAQQAQVAQQAQQAQQQAQLPPPPPPPPPKPQPPPINYKFIGYIGPPDNKIAILHDGANLMFVRREETVGQGLRVLEIGYESIKFGFTDPQFKDETRTIPMSSAL